jgi:hypothetical protein
MNLFPCHAELLNDALSNGWRYRQVRELAKKSQKANPPLGLNP